MQTQLQTTEHGVYSITAQFHTLTTIWRFTSHLVVKSAVFPLQNFLDRSSRLQDNNSISWYSRFSTDRFEAVYRKHLTLLLRQMTGHKLKPNVQQQQRQPHRSHLTFTGNVFLRQLFTRLILALNSSGATWGSVHVSIVEKILCNTFSWQDWMFDTRRYTRIYLNWNMISNCQIVLIMPLKHNERLCKYMKCIYYVLTVTKQTHCHGNINLSYSVKLLKTLTFPVSAEGNSDSNLLLSPNLQVKRKYVTSIHNFRLQCLTDNQNITNPVVHECMISVYMLHFSFKTLKKY